MNPPIDRIVAVNDFVIKFAHVTGSGSASATESSRQSARRLIGTQVSVLIARQPGLDWIAAK